MTTVTPGQTGDPGTASFGTDEVAEILQTFAGSAWTSMRLTIGRLTVAAGKDGPPPEPAAPAAAVTAGLPSAAAAPAAGSTSPAPPAAAPATGVAASGPATPEPDSAPSVSAPAGEAPVEETGLVTVSSPTVGAFWVAPDPGSPPFVEVGAHVEAGEQLAIVEVMKLMNPVLSEVSGEVVAVRARNAELVEFGQPLFLIRPND